MKKKIIIKIDGMSCRHCVHTVTENLQKLDNILKVKVDLKKKEALVTYQDNIDIDEIKKAITELGYELVGVIQC